MGSTPGIRTQILRVEDDGSIVEASFGKGNCVAEVFLKTRGTSKSLGKITSLVDRNKGSETLKARCACHKQCICWISTSKHCDLLLQWLAEGSKCDAAAHSSQSKELKKHIGMKIRG